MSDKAELLWKPSNPGNSALAAFTKHVEQKYNIQLADYQALHQWSIDNIQNFWAEVWDWVAPADLEAAVGPTGGVKASKRWDQVIDLTVPRPSIPAWFSGAKLNWAENMLRTRSSSQTALIETTEPAPGQTQLSYKRLSYADLYQQVHETQLALAKLGLKQGQILGFYGPTSISSVILLLAATSLGAIWSSAASDFGPTGVLERFEQFGDSLWGVFGVESVRYNGKVLPQRPKLQAVVDGLRKARGENGNKFWVGIGDYLGEGNTQNGLKADDGEAWMSWEELGRIGREEWEEKGRPNEIEFWQGDFDAPLWILFSSGTTGKPKPIVHRAGGMLLQSKKEHVLHGDMGPEDVFFYYTTPGWMMYNYLVSGLQTGCAVVLFDGSPLFKPEWLWDMTYDLGVTIFGTSAKYIDVLSKGYVPKDHHEYPKLKQVLSTGSPLKPELFSWVYDNIKKDLTLGSITGGTDICSLFGAHNTSLPVYRGEIQCLGLGMAVESWSEEGVPVPRGEQGDLVCVKPFPCMPVFFWNDKGGERYRASYFDKFEGVWAHGDFCIIGESREGNGGGLVMLGRSDGVLNPSGIRFGSSEIYEVLDSVDSVVDSLVIGQKTQGGSDERVVLFVQLQEGKLLGDDLMKEIKLKIRTSRSARHVPERILQVGDVPHTVNGKKVEIPVKKLLNGAPMASINFSTLRNPSCLDEYERLGETLRSELK
ncbi:acetoacetate-CoA ligase [Meredithblackwellia eburnea MCA 4105]